MRISDWSSDVCSSDLALACAWARLGAVSASAATPARYARRGRPVWPNEFRRMDSPLKTYPTPWRIPDVRDEDQDASTIITGRVSHNNRSEERRVGKKCVRTCKTRW